MKSVIKKSIILVVLGVFAFTSCSKEVIKPEIESSLEVIEKGGSKDVVQITVEFFSDVTETRKNEIRDEYERDGILISYKKCTDAEDKEVWDIICSRCKRDDDVPIRTSSCPGSEDSPKSTSDPDPSEGCDVKRVSIGVLCDIDY